MNENKILKNVDDKWEVTTNRYVAYIDIMGFKDLVARASHDEIYGLMKRIEYSKQVNENINWDGNNLGLVKTTTYSDSIMIYSKDDSVEALHSFICTVSGITYDLFCELIPHKGAISFGIMTLDTISSIFFVNFNSIIYHHFS